MWLPGDFGCMCLLSLLRPLVLLLQPLLDQVPVGFSILPLAGFVKGVCIWV